MSTSNSNHGATINKEEIIPEESFSEWFKIKQQRLRNKDGSKITTEEIGLMMLVLPSWGKTPSEEQLDSIMPWSETLPETCHRTYHQIIENEAEVK